MCLLCGLMYCTVLYGAAVLDCVVLYSYYTVLYRTATSTAIASATAINTASATPATTAALTSARIGSDRPDGRSSWAPG